MVNELEDQAGTACIPAIADYLSQWHPEMFLGCGTSRKTTELFDGTETAVPDDSPFMSCEEVPVTTPMVKAD
jgi:hypothetical protein